MTQFRYVRCGFGKLPCSGTIREPIDPPDQPFESQCDGLAYGPHKVTYLPRKP